ncbi:MAG TPA: S41 family peptidase [Saprospiraceae bacterium]|nr:S41 family peptidase [Saprospiraceae bacterium]HMQ84923.1 S41 family peptidase [Saprospiraceae bacterium]
MKNTIAILFMFVGSLVNAQNYNGKWESIGYGRLLTIEDENFEIIDYTNISCTPSMKGKLDELTDKITLENDTLTITNGINDYFFVRSNSAICTNLKKKKNDPIYNFEVLAETFKTHYAYFKERNIDWEKMYHKYRSQINKKTTDPELYLVIKEMLDEFGDKHIQFSASDKVEKKAMQLSASKSDTEKPKKIPGWQLAEQVAATFFDAIKSKRGGTIRWGILDDNVGYLQVNQMIGFGDYGIDDNASVPEFWKQYIPIMSGKSPLPFTNDEQNGISEIMDEVMMDLKNTKALILDMRFNGGGKDEVGLEILSRFNPEKKQIGIKKAIHGNGFSNEVPIYVVGTENAYTKPIYLLTTRASASATEICVLASLSLENIKRIGGNTEGITSDMLDKTLPNGWEFSLSNEIYLDNHGKNYEHTGISPDIVVYQSDTRAEQYLTIKNGLENKKDQAIEKAIQTIHESTD